MTQTSGMRIFFKHGTREILNEISQPFTECYIVEPPAVKGRKPSLIAKSVVGKHHRDVPNRVIARRFAFEKAITQVADKDLRAALWTDYITNFRNPKITNHVEQNSGKVEENSGLRV